MQFVFKTAAPLCCPTAIWLAVNWKIRTCQISEWGIETQLEKFLC